MWKGVREFTKRRRRIAEGGERQLTARTGAVRLQQQRPAGPGSSSSLKLQSVPDFHFGEFCLTLGPFRHSTLAHQRPRRRCLVLSRSFLGFRHLDTPSSWSFPCAFAKPETWRTRLGSALSRGEGVTAGA